MNPLRVTASNYRTFAELDVEIPTGCTAVSGPNGAGKSSILNLVDVALFAERGELPALLTTEEERLELQLEFEHAGELYRVRRSYSATGRGKTTLDFERLGPSWHVEADEHGDPMQVESPPEWEPLTRENTAQTQELINATLGLSRATFRASAFLRQGDGAAFTEAQPADRKRVLAEILGLDLWDRMLEKARGELRVAEHELAGTAMTMQRLEATVAERDEATATRNAARTLRDSTSELVATAEEELDEAQTQLAVVAGKNERYLRLGAELAAASREYETVRERLERAHAAAAAILDCRIEGEELAADAARIPQLENELAAIVEATRAASEITSRRNEVVAQIDARVLARDRLIDQAGELRATAAEQYAKAQHLYGPIGEASQCDRCGQTLGAEAAERAAKSYRDEAVELEQRAAEIATNASADADAIAGLREQLDTIEIPTAPEPAWPIEEQLTSARVAATKHAAVTERISLLERDAASAAQLAIDVDAAARIVGDRRAAVQEAEKDAGDVTAAETVVGVAKRTVHDTRAALEQRAGELARAEQRLEQIAAAAAELQQLRAATAGLHGQVDVLKLAERAYGRDGIPALIVENAAIPQLELEANRILAELGGATADCRIELRTQRALKGSEQLRETLDIVIRTLAGDRPYETFSGGERTRLNLALRIALARLLAHRRGAESRLLAIDEPEFLDDAGVARLADVLRGLAGDFDRILLVSHHSGLAGSFDQTITVRRDGGGSAIDAGVREAVTA